MSFIPVHCERLFVCILVTLRFVHRCSYQSLYCSDQACFGVCAPQCYYLQRALHCKNVYLLYMLHNALACKELCVVKTCICCMRLHSAITCKELCVVTTCFSCMCSTVLCCKNNFLACMFHRATMPKVALRCAVHYSVNIYQNLPLSQKKRGMSQSLWKRHNVYKHITLT